MTYKDLKDAETVLMMDAMDAEFYPAAREVERREMLDAVRQLLRPFEMAEIEARVNRTAMIRASMV
jgi:hypothetical protein